MYQGQKYVSPQPTGKCGCLHMIFNQNPHVNYVSLILKTHVSGFSVYGATLFTVGHITSHQGKAGAQGTEANRQATPPTLGSE